MAGEGGWVPSPDRACARCGTVRRWDDMATVGVLAYCHPALSRGATCYMVVQAGDPLARPAGGLSDGEVAVLAQAHRCGRCGHLGLLHDDQGSPVKPTYARCLVSGCDC